MLSGEKGTVEEGREVKSSPEELPPPQATLPPSSLFMTTQLPDTSKHLG